MTLRKWAAVAGAAALMSCGEQPATPSAGDTGTAQVRFVDRAAEAGLSFVHANGMTGAFLEAEIYAPGVALFDADNDGDLDLYVVQGGLQGRCGGAPPVRCGDRLFRNELAPGAPLKFTDVTTESAIRAMSYGMGIAAGDFDNDGWTDLYRTGLDANVLLRNNGNGTFTDVTAAAGVADPRSWSVSASFVDIDRDEWLDLYVSNYLAYSVDTDLGCFSRTGAPDYCDPTAYRPDRDRVYRNRQDGTFADVTNRALPTGSTGPALGVSAADFNGDAWPDIYVANDRRENDLWLNQRDGTFRNGALVAGVALNRDGRAEASMGVDAGDFDNDGDEDLFLTNFTSEGHTLYINTANGAFEDAGSSSGIRLASLPYTGFGTAWMDADNDGWLDLLTANGAVRTIEALARTGDAFPLHQRKQFFRNRGDGRFAAVSAGPAFESSEVGRGVAFGDVDNDGDTDAVVGVNNGALQLLINESRRTHHWLGIRLIGPASRPRDMVGAQVIVTTGSGRRLWRRARADGSYASANDPRVLAGIGADTSVSSVRVRWPDGSVEEWRDVTIDRWTTVRQGAGRRQ